MTIGKGRIGSSKNNHHKKEIESSYKIGHRKRMRERVLKHGAENLSDYEILEMILYTIVPRRDTKILAKKLISQFGSFIDLLKASPSLMKDAGLPEKMIALLQTPKIVAETLRKEEGKQMPCLNNWNILRSYLMVHPLYKKDIPTSYILYLDTRNFLLCLEELPENNMFLDAHRPIAVRVLELHATALIIVHKDIQSSSLTLAQKSRALKIALAPLAIKLHDTVIIQDGSLSSLDKSGFLRE